MGAETIAHLWRARNVTGLRNHFSCWVAVAALATGLSAGVGRAQLPEPGVASDAPNPLTDSTVKPGKMVLFDLRGAIRKRCAGARRGGLCRLVRRRWRCVGQRRGAADWQGRDYEVVTVVAKDYQLTWTPTDAMMGPSGDMGYTWGHFEGRSKDANGNPVLTSGRYMTVWRKGRDGNWKVVLDAGANEPLAGGRLLQTAGRALEAENRE